MKNIHYFLIVLCFFAFVQCSPELQKSVQKTAVAGIISSGVDVAKGKLPERTLALKRVGKTDLYEASDLLGSYKVVMLNDTTGVLYASVNFEQISTLVMGKMNEQIDKGAFVLKFGKGKETKNDTTKTEVK